MMARRAVIIGSGLGGLSCGVMLARMGWRVTVLERQQRIGGCLQCFMRGGARFETGMHFVGSLEQGQILQPYASFLGLDDVPFSRLDTDAYNVISLAGDRFMIPNGREAFVQSLSKQAGGHADELAAYYELVRRVSANTSVASVGSTVTDMGLFTRYHLMPFDEAIASVVHDELLQRILVGHLSLYQGVKGHTPFTLHAFITDFYDASAFRTVGGSERMALSMADAIKNAGGEILADHRATAITTDAGVASGVIAADRHFAADAVISAIHPAQTLALLPEKSGVIRPAFRKRVASIPNTIGIFAVYLHFSAGKMPYMNRNFFAYPDGNPWGCEDYSDETWPRGYLYMHHIEEAGQKWATSGVILSYMKYEDVACWKGTAVGHRGDDYADFKRRHAERLLDVVEREFPGLRASLKGYYTSTPLTYEDYTGTPEGCIYGMVKDVAAIAGNHLGNATRLPGLYLAGQSINSHGMLGTVVGSLGACSAIVGESRLYEAIRRHTKNSNF